MYIYVHTEQIRICFQSKSLNLIRLACMLFALAYIHSVVNSRNNNVEWYTVEIYAA